MLLLLTEYFSQYQSAFQVFQYLLGLAQLPGPTINYQNIRYFGLSFLDPCVATPEGLLHGGIIIAWSDIVDIETPVF